MKLLSTQTLWLYGFYDNICRSVLSARHRVAAMPMPVLVPVPRRATATEPAVPFRPLIFFLFRSATSGTQFYLCTHAIKWVICRFC